MRHRFQLSLVIIAFCAVAVCLSNGQEAATAKAELDLGVQAYKDAKHEEAIAHFKQAVTLDPNLLTARLYLATAYAQQYIPGADTEENNQMGRQAIDEFEEVLTLHPTHEQEVNSLKSLAYLYFNMKKFDAAKEYQKKVVEIDPNDPETYYTIGVIDWTQTYQPRMEERAKLNLKPDAPLINTDVCWKIRAANEELVKDGIEMLTKALSLRPDYDDAMAYMNLLYRERADIQCGNKQAHDADLKTADQWVDLTMATKKARQKLLTPQHDKFP